MVVPNTFSDLSLEKLKIMFDGRISPRRLGCVEQNYDLLKYLWQEDKIDDSYLEKFKRNKIEEISRHDDAFSRYLMSADRCRYTGQNEYAKQRENDRCEQMAQSKCDTKKSLEQFAERKFKIHSLIRSDIGRKWREFGRHLKIKEGALDNIDYEQKEIDRKVDEIFKVFEQHCHSNEYAYVLGICSALELSRRKDLSKKVREIMER